MRKELGGNDESGGYTFDKTTNASQPEGTSSSIPTGRKGESLSVSTVVDVSEASLLSKTRTDESPLARVASRNTVAIKPHGVFRLPSEGRFVKEERIRSCSCYGTCVS
jgi:hypothetical protein